MPVLMAVRVGGRPRTKGSLKVYCQKDRRHTVHVTEEVEESIRWRKAVARAVREKQLAGGGSILAWPGPVEVRLVFHFPREQSVNGGPIPTHQTEWPTAITVGDADKLARNVLDALSMPTKKADVAKCSGLIKDDSQVVILSVAKFWVSGDTEPGVDILVMTIESTP